LELATHVSGVGSDDSGVKGESSGLGGGGDGDGLQVGESRVLERVDVSEVSRLGREDGSLDGSLNDEGVVLPEEEPLKVGRHLERGGKVEGAVEEEERKEEARSARRFIWIRERFWSLTKLEGMRRSIRCRIKGSPLNW